MASTLSIQASDHLIKSVTVFKSSKAEVVRNFTLSLKKGQNKVEIRGLSSSIDTHSVRVSGLGDARLFDVVCTLTTNTATSYAPDSSSEVIRTLSVKRAALESEKAVRDNESQLLLKYAQTLNGEHVTPTQMGLFLQSYVEQGRKTLEATTELNERIVQINRQIDAEREKVAAKRGSTLGQVDIVIVADTESSVELKLTYIVSNVQWKPTYELHATTENGKPLSSVSLHYRARVTQGTGEDWNNTSLTLSTVASDTFVRRIPELKPIKLRPRMSIFGPAKGNGFSPFNNRPGGGLFGPSPPQQLFGQSQQHNTFGQPQQQGLFGQQSSSGRPQQQSTFGQPQQQSLFGQPQQQQSQQQQTQAAAFGTPLSFGTSGPSFGTAVPVSTESVHGGERERERNPEIPVAEEHTTHDDGEFEQIDGPTAITEPSTIVSETPIAISFSVHGESTIPSDGVDHQVSVAVLPFESKISYICIPRIDPRVYLQCEVKNSSEYRLLSGPVTVILDDSYVSKTSINDINTGDNFECTLGNDASTNIKYSRKAGKTVKSDGGTFSEVTNTTTYSTKISIHNKHQFDITDLIVREVIPTSEDKRPNIILRKPAGLADAKDGVVVDLKDEKDGLTVQWESLVDGKGGEKEGRFEWKWKVDSGEKVSLEAEWEIKVPGEAAWVETY